MFFLVLRNQIGKVFRGKSQTKKLHSEVRRRWRKYHWYTTSVSEQAYCWLWNIHSGPKAGFKIYLSMLSHLHHCDVHHHHHVTFHRVSHWSALCQQVQYYWMTELHTVLTTELLCSDISFGWVLFQKDMTLFSGFTMPLFGLLPQSCLTAFHLLHDLALSTSRFRENEI